MTSEFGLIARFFSRPVSSTRLGVGDDAALMDVSPGQTLVVSTDLLVAGRHFFPDVDPWRLGVKSAAVNLSDMAAMGANPRWATLGIALPEPPDDDWLGRFSDGFHDTLRRYGTDWVGGDTTAGPLTIAVTVMGEVPPLQALTRSGARVGDDLWVSGTVGGAALGLQCRQGRWTLSEEDRRHCEDRLDMPEPRVSLGRALRGLAHAAIDVSDGLLADLGHILALSGVGAEVLWDAVPLASALRSIPVDARQALALAGGDDYELCFTAPAVLSQRIREAAASAGVSVTRIGRILPAGQQVVRNAAGQVLDVKWRGFDHFDSAGRP